MRRVAASFALAAAGWAAIACAGSETSNVELLGLNLDYGFLVILDGDGNPTRLTAPFGIEGDRLIFGSLPVITFVGGESSFVLVGFDDTDAAASAGGFQRERASEITAVLKAPPNIPQREEKAAGGVLTRGLPEGTKLFSGALLTGLIRLENADQYREKILGAVTLEFPIEAEYCRIPKETLLGPFTDQVDAFTGALSAKPNVHQMFWLDPRRLFVATWTGVAVLEPGQPLQPGSRALTLAEGMPTPIAGLRVFAGDVDPRTRSSTISTRALIAGNNPDTRLSKIWELEIRGTSIALVRETEQPNPIGEISILYDGRQLVSSDEGRIFERDPNTGALTLIYELDTFVLKEEQIVHLRAVDDDRYPMIAATQGRVHLFDTQSGRFTYEELSQEGVGALDKLDFNLLQAGPNAGGALEFWAGGERDTLFRKIGAGNWERIHLQFPPRFFPCVAHDEESGALYYPGIWWKSAFTRDYIHLIPKECTAVVQVRREDLCVSVLQQDELDVEFTDDYLTAIDALEGHLAVGGDHGRTYRSAW